MKRKVITHDGQFHADEIFAIALLECIYGTCTITRTRKILPKHKTPEYWLIDVGGELDPTNLNFDHHQDLSLDASCLLVLEHLFRKDKISEFVFDRLFIDFMSVSMIDRGSYAQANGFQVNSLIKSLNHIQNLPNRQDTGFKTALIIAKAYVFSVLEQEDSSQKSRGIFNTGGRIGNALLVCDEYPTFWKEHEPKALVLIAPNTSGLWCVHSIDSELVPLIQTGKEEFFHPNRFLAIFEHKEDAVKCGMFSIEHFNKSSKPTKPAIFATR